MEQHFQMERQIAMNEPPQPPLVYEPADSTDYLVSQLVDMESDKLGVIRKKHKHSKSRDVKHKDIKKGNPFLYQGVHATLPDLTQFPREPQSTIRTNKSLAQHIERGRPVEQSVSQKISSIEPGAQSGSLNPELKELVSRLVQEKEPARATSPKPGSITSSTSSYNGSYMNEFLKYVNTASSELFDDPKPEKKPRKSTPKNIRDLDKTCADGRYKNVVDGAKRPEEPMPFPDFVKVEPPMTALESEVVKIRKVYGTPRGFRKKVFNTAHVMNTIESVVKGLDTVTEPVALKPSTYGQTESFEHCIVQSQNYEPVNVQVQQLMMSRTPPQTEPMHAPILQQLINGGRAQYLVNHTTAVSVAQDRFYPMTSRPIPETPKKQRRRKSKDLNATELVPIKTEPADVEAAPKKQRRRKSKECPDLSAVDPVPVKVEHADPPELTPQTGTIVPWKEVSHTKNLPNIYKMLTQKLEDDLREFENSLGLKAPSGTDDKKKILYDIYEILKSNRTEQHLPKLNGQVKSFENEDIDRRLFEEFDDDRPASEGCRCESRMSVGSHGSDADERSARVRLIDCVKYNKAFRKRFPHIRFRAMSFRRKIKFRPIKFIKNSPEPSVSSAASSTSSSSERLIGFERDPGKLDEV